MSDERGERVMSRGILAQTRVFVLALRGVLLKENIASKELEKHIAHFEKWIRQMENEIPHERR